MRILMLNYEYPPLGGGGGLVHKAIAEELATRHEVTVVTSGFEGLAAEEVVSGVNVHRVKVIGRRSLPNASLTSMLSYYPRSLRKGQELIDRLRPDILNSHFAVPTGPSAVRLAQRNKLPHVLSVHGGDLYDPSKTLSPHRIPGLFHTVRWVLGAVDQVVAQSANTADNARRIYGCPAEKVKIIPLGIVQPPTTTGSRARLQLNEDQTVLVTVGRLVARKANEQLIEVLAKIPDKRIVLVIVGDGPERGRLENLAKTLGVADRVRLTGFVEETEKFELLSAADIYVSTTQHEGFGLMFLEAMVCGLPVVTYDHGGQRDFIDEGKSGCLVPLNDKARFQEVLERLVSDVGLRESIGAAGKETARSYTAAGCAESYESLYEELITKAGVPAVQK